MRSNDAKDPNRSALLGLISNQIWYDDPGRLSNFLARYDFVAKAVAGGRNVAEVGGGDAFAARIVLRCVEQLTIYQVEPAFVADICCRKAQGEPLEAHVHDILLSVLPERHDRIFSLDLLENISRPDEHVYLTNLRNSLTDHGILIIGTPSGEVQTNAAIYGAAREVTCKTGPELKSLLERYFTRVVLASMDGESVYAGVHSGADYLLAVCSD